MKNKTCSYKYKLKVISSSIKMFVYCNNKCISCFAQNLKKNIYTVARFQISKQRTVGGIAFLAGQK
jgi:hypothetical protein